MGCVYLKICPMAPVKTSKKKMQDDWCSKQICETTVLALKRYRISTVSLIIRAATAFLYVKDHEKMRSTLLVINHGLFFLDINCWGNYFKKINLAILWQRTWKKAWRIFRAYFSAETEINLFSSDGVQHVCCENRRMQSLNSEAQCWKCEGVGHMTFINGNISAYRHIKILTD